MIGIAVKRGGGGVNSVTTAYQSSFAATLDAGFTTTLGNLYQTDRNSLDNMWSQYLAAKQLSEATVSFLRKNNSVVTVTLADAYTELKELEGNYYNARTYNAYTDL